MTEIQGIDHKMTANDIEPAYHTHPGAILKDEIEYRGITQHKLAQQMGIPYSALNEILNEAMELNPDICASSFILRTGFCLYSSTAYRTLKRFTYWQ